MYYKIFIFLSLMIVTGFSACSKRKHSSVKVTVMDQSSGTPVAHCKVWIVKNYRKVDLLNSEPREGLKIASSETDQNGEAELFFSCDLGSRYEVTYEASPGYYKQDRGNNTIKKGRNELTLAVLSYSVLKMRFISSNPLGKYISFPPPIGYSDESLTSTPIDKFFTRTIDAYGARKYSYHVDSAGLRRDYNLEVNLKGKDTTYCTVYY